MIEDIKIGRLYKRKKYSTWRGNISEKDIVIVTETKNHYPYTGNIKFYYLDDPDEIFEWNDSAFIDGFEEQ